MGIEIHLPEDLIMDDRRTTITLSDAQIELIAERAAEVALERVYTHIGKSVVSKILWAAGAGTLAIIVWLNGGAPKV